MFICLPILFGVESRVKPHTDRGPFQCPRCNNVSVNYVKKTEWFCLFFVPLIPFSSTHIYLCTICQLASQTQPGEGWNASVPLPQYTGGFQEPNRPGYQPAYITPKYSPPGQDSKA